MPARYKRTFYWIAGLGAAAGAVYWLWPYVKSRFVQGTLKLEKPTIKRGKVRSTPDISYLN